MFCLKCGTAAVEGTRFCPSCGTPFPAEVPIGAAPGETDERKRKGGAGFFGSPAGIALVVILGIAVLAGITLGIIFLVKGSSNDSVDAATVDVWEEYESTLEDDSGDLAQINMDANALTQTQADLKKTQDRVTALEKVLAKTGGTKNRRVNANVNPTNIRDIKAAQMAAALAAYNQYVKKMDQFFGALIGALVNNQLFVAEVVNNLNAILAELQKLSADVKTLSEKFLKDNDKVTVADFDPGVLLFAKQITPQVEQKVAEAQAAEAARIAAEQAAAAAAAEEARQASGHWERVPRGANPCGDPSCDICYTSVWVQD